MSTMKEMFEALHLAEIQITADLNARIQQPTEEQANRVILEVIIDAIMAGKKAGLTCDCPNHQERQTP